MVVITGLFRSGTTLTQKVIDSHSDAEIVNQGVLPFFKCIQRKLLELSCSDREAPLETKWFGDSSYNSQSFKGIFFDDSDIGQILEEVRGVCEESSDQYSGIRFYEALNVNFSPGNLECLIDQIELSVRQYRGAESKRVVGIKELFGSLLSVPLIDASSGRVKVIQVVRDPRDVLASRNYGKYASCVGGQYSVYLVANMWRKTILNAKRMELTCPGSFLSVRYEDLVRYPDGVVSEIDRFLGLEVQRGQFSPGSFKSEVGGSWEANSSFEIEKGFGLGSVGRWKAVLPDDVVKVLEYMCSFEMLAMGYAPTFDEHAREKGFSNFEEDDLKILDWIKASGSVLDEDKKRYELKRREAVIGP